jgi:hypothetical protein
LLGDLVHPPPDVVDADVLGDRAQVDTARGAARDRRASNAQRPFKARLGGADEGLLSVLERLEVLGGVREAAGRVQLRGAG